MNPEQLSDALRNGEDLYLWCRRALVITSFVAIGCMMMVGLFQMGIIQNIPELPLSIFQAEKVDAAPEAYQRMNLPMPDAFLGLLSYAVTVALVTLGGPNRYQQSWLWIIVIVLLVKVTIDAVQAARLTWEQWAVHQAFCSWCLLAALATFIAVPLAVPEAWGAIKNLFATG